MFSPTAAVLVHSLVTLNDDVFAILKAEEALLIHRCTARADRSRRAWVNTAGSEVLVVYSEETLIWEVSAGLLDQTGLGNYHPGRALSDQSLAWANGGTLPFQFREGNHGIFVYESPSLDPPPGDLPGVSFRIRLQFGEFDAPGNPDDGGEFGLVDYEEIPAQSAVELSEAWRHALLLDVFNSVDAFGTAPFTAALYSGDPESGGVELFPPVTLTPWTTYDETAAATTRGRNHVAVEWSDATSYERTISHVLFERNGLRTAVALAAPLVVPALHGVRAPINALALQLTWPWDITGSAPSTATLPSRKYLTYSLGGTRVAAGIAPVLSVTFTSEDLLTDSDLIEGVPATEEYWRVYGLTVSPVIITGTNPAAPGGWAIAVVFVNSGATLAMRQRHTMLVPEGYVVELVEQPLMELEAAAS